jgi:hypothetical protein
VIAFLYLAAASADLDTLNQAVARCDRNAVNPMFAGEAARRSEFLLDAYHEQQAIVSDRLTLADQRRALREPGTTSSKSTAAEQKQLAKQLDLQQADLDDRQKALNDKRMLEGIREDAMDSMRHYFLLNCPAGGGQDRAR